MRRPFRPDFTTRSMVIGPSISYWNSTRSAGDPIEMPLQSGTREAGTAVVRKPSPTLHRACQSGTTRCAIPAINGCAEPASSRGSAARCSRPSGVSTTRAADRALVLARRHSGQRDTIADEHRLRSFHPHHGFQHRIGQMKSIGDDRRPEFVRRQLLPEIIGMPGQHGMDAVAEMGR